MFTHTSAPRRTTASRPAVGLTATATTLLLLAVQLLVMQVRGSRNGMTLTGVLMQWDSQWMTLISRYGYAGFAHGGAGGPGEEPVEWQSVAFFPGYPWLVRAVAAPLRVLTGAEVTVGVAVVVSAAASVAMVWGLARIATDHLWPAVTGQDAGPVTAGVLTLAAGVLALGAPMSVVYVMPYSEAFFTALAVWALHQLLSRRYLTAGALVFVAGLTRITAVVLVLTLAVAASVELWRWWQARRGRRTLQVLPQRQDAASARLDAASAGPDTGRLVRALVAPVLGMAGTAGYIAWADRQTAEIGGYFAAQDRGWHSGFDAGAATWEWLTTHPWNLLSTGVHDGTMPGYAISSWSMVLVGVLCVVSLWPMVTGLLPWQLWLPAVAVAGMTLGSNGIMHSRPRLLLMTVLLLLLPVVVRAVAALRGRRDARSAGRPAGSSAGRPALVAVPVVAGVVWCVVGAWVSAEMLVGFAYAI